MKEFVCIFCGYNCKGEKPPEVCPVCGGDSSNFSENGDINRNEDKKQ